MNLREAQLGLLRLNGYDSVAEVANQLRGLDPKDVLSLIAGASQGCAEILHELVGKQVLVKPVSMGSYVQKDESHWARGVVGSYRLAVVRSEELPIDALTMYVNLQTDGSNLGAGDTRPVELGRRAMPHLHRLREYGGARQQGFNHALRAVVGPAARSLHI
ncbi:MAG: hypothetical protein AAF413_01790 [Patescibacteria group bacterium]